MLKQELLSRVVGGKTFALLWGLAGMTPPLSIIFKLRSRLDVLMPRLVVPLPFWHLGLAAAPGACWSRLGDLPPLAIRPPPLRTMSTLSLMPLNLWSTLILKVTLNCLQALSCNWQILSFIRSQRPRLSVKRPLPKHSCAVCRQQFFLNTL